MRNPKLWSLFPILLVIGIGSSLYLAEMTAVKIVLAVALALGLALGLLACTDLQRFFWAFRGFTALMFLASAGYVIHMWAIGDAPPANIRRPEDPTLGRALLLFGTVGLPSLWFTVTGRVHRLIPAFHGQIEGEQGVPELATDERRPEGTDESIIPDQE